MRYLSLFSLFLLISCASIGTLEGGDKDTQAPKIIKSNLSKTSFNEKYITLEFDEYIELNNAEKNIKIFPEHTTLKFQINKKKLTIKFDSTLNANTTYYLKIDNGIKDVHEGNQFSYDYLFSTGSYLDTGYINIKIDNYKDFKNLKVSLLLNQASDSLKQFNSFYTLNVNSEIVEFKGLKKNRYFPWIFTDNDQNNKPDLYSPAGFTNAVIPDTTIKIRVYEWMPRLKIKQLKTDGQYIKVFYEHCEKYDQALEYQFPGQSENLIYANEDSSLFEKFESGPVKDTISPIDVYGELHDLIINSLKMIHGKQYCIQYKLPQFYQNNSGYNKLENTRTVYYTKPENTMIYIPRMDEMDTISLKNTTEIEEQKLSLLTINIEDSTGRQFDLKIKKDSKVVYSISNNKNIQIFIEPGTYQIEIYESEKNNKFNPVELKNGPSLIYTKTLILKASWEEIQVIKL